MDTDSATAVHETASNAAEQKANNEPTLENAIENDFLPSQVSRVSFPNLLETAPTNIPPLKLQKLDGSRSRDYLHVIRSLLSEPRPKRGAKRGATADADFFIRKTDDDDKCGKYSDEEHKDGSTEMTELRKHHQDAEGGNSQDILWRISTNKPLKPMHATLLCVPSMTFVLCIIHSAFIRLRAGVPSSQIVHWAMCGAIPFHGGYSCLTEFNQKKLAGVRPFFNAITAPSAAALEYYSELLFIAISSSELKLHPLRGSINSNGSAVDNIETPIAQDVSMSSKRTAKKDDHRQHLSYYNAPLMAARIVEELDLGQQVLDNAFSIMGLTPLCGNEGNAKHRADTANNQIDGDKRKVWNPPALPSAAAYRVCSRVDVFAVLVISCKFCTGWESWTYESHSRKTAIFGESKRTSATRGGGIELFPTKVQFEQKFKRHVVWNDAHQLRSLSNGSSVQSYVDFINTELHHDRSVDSRLDSFMSWLECQRFQCAAKAGHRILSREIVLPNTVIAGAPNPNVSCHVGEANEEKLNDISESVEPVSSSGHDWEDANGIGSYVLYHDGNGEEQLLDNPMGYHPHYCLLLEFLCFKGAVDPCDVHEKVRVLEQELCTTIGFCPTKTKPIRNSKRQTNIDEASEV